MDKTAISALAATALADTHSHLEIVAVTVIPAGKRTVVRILLGAKITFAASPLRQSPQLDLDEIADATRIISGMLDDEKHQTAIGKAAYVLEVSSPGLSRALTTATDFGRNIGRLITLETTREELNSNEYRLAAVSPEALWLAPASTKEAQEATLDHPTINKIPLADIQKGHIAIEFS